MRQGLMEEDTETICKQLVLPSERGITISTQYKVSTGCHVYIGEWWEEILLEDMLEDTQVMKRHRKSRITWCFNRFTKHCARIDCVGYACET